MRVAANPAVPSSRQSLLSFAAGALLLVASPAGAQPAAGGPAGGASGGSAGSFISSPLTFDYGLSARTEYVDNYGFRGASTFVSTVGPSATFRMDSETLRLSGNVSLFATHFSNEKAGRSRTSDPRFRFDGTYLRERSTFSLSTSYFRDRQFGTSTVQQAGGFQLGSGTRTVFSITPAYSYAVTERLSFNASYGLTTITTDGAAPNQVDTQSGSLSAGMQYRLTELDGIGISVSQTSYSTTPTTTDSETRSVQASWNRRWTETTTVSVFAGITQSDVRSRSAQTVCLVPINFCQDGTFPFQTFVNNQSSNTTSPTYGFTVSTQVAQRTSVSGSGSRSIQPGAAGALVERTQVSLDLTHQFMERLSGSVDYIWASSQFTGLGSGGTSNATQTLSGNLGYQLPDNWSLGAGARISQTDLRGVQPRSKAVFVSIAKTWPNRRLWP